MTNPPTKPRLIVHGGAGAISRTNLPVEAYARYAAKLQSVNAEALRLLQNGAPALDAAAHAVRALEDCPLFNCGKGAVFTRDGTVELEASVSFGGLGGLLFFLLYVLTLLTYSVFVFEF